MEYQLDLTLKEKASPKTYLYYKLKTSKLFDKYREFTCESAVSLMKSDPEFTILEKKVNEDNYILIKEN